MQIDSTHQGNPLNGDKTNAPRNQSRFPLSYILAHTARFGEITPHFAMEVVPKDKVDMQCSHSARTYSFKAPTMQDINFKKDYFSVPLQAILPFNWDKIYENPNIGDDVPADAYTAVSEFDYKIANFISAFISDWVTAYGNYDFSDGTQSGYANTLNAAIKDLVNILIFGEYFYSAGSLLNVLGHSMQSQIYAYSTSDGKQLNWDEIFDLAMSVLSKSSEFTITLYDGSTYYVSPSYDYLQKAGYINFRRALEIIRDNGGVSSFTFTLGTNESVDINAVREVFSILQFTNAPSGVAEPIDLARLYAYQLVCHHYFSNDSVDYIYSANLYRELLSSYIETLPVSPISKTFSYNGLSIPYDWTSSHFFDGMLNDCTTNSDLLTMSVFCSLIFSFRHSLRYVDYFTGSKTRPLAIGNTDVSVVSNQFSVVDVTRKIQLQRFLNAVNRTGRKISNYVKGLFGVDMAQDFHDPIHLGWTQDSLFGSEVSNTGVDQLSEPNSVTSVMMSNASRYAFTYFADRPAILIGVTYFDFNRIYSKTTDRQFFHSDRFDMFNPFMQYIGDQPVKYSELDDYYDYSVPQTFGYQTRYSEYKQRISRAVGGFVRNLPGYAFVVDDSMINTPNSVNPSFIRSSCCELDPYYVSLTGFSLGSYFHFIIFGSNQVSADRPMSYIPQIL